MYHVKNYIHTEVTEQAAPFLEVIRKTILCYLMPYTHLLKMFTTQHQASPHCKVKCLA